MLVDKLIHVLKRVYPRYGLRNDDIILASYPKSGNTWIRFIWLNLVSIKELDEKKIDFYTVNGPLNAEYDTHSYGSISYKSLPRIVKTHRLYDNRFSRNKSVYLVRNPGDVMISYFEYKKASVNGFNTTCGISDFIRSDKFGIEKWCMHVKSWKEKANTIVKYESLREDAFDQIKIIMQELKLSNKVKDETIKKAIRNSSFKQMRKLEEKKGRPSSGKKLDKDFKFTRSGNIGEWKDRLSDNDLSYMADMLKRYDLQNYYKMKLFI